MSRFGVAQLDPNINDLERIDSLSNMDAPENMALLYYLGQQAATKDVKPEHFPANFDLS